MGKLRPDELFNLACSLIGKKKSNLKCLQVPSLIPVLLYKLGRERNPKVVHAVLYCLPNLGTHRVWNGHAGPRLTVTSSTSSMFPTLPALHPRGAADPVHAGQRPQDDGGGPAPADCSLEDTGRQGCHDEEFLQTIHCWENNHDWLNESEQFNTIQK